MKIGVIADTHIPTNAKQIPKAILEEFKTVDMIIHAGDFVDCEVLEALKKICPRVIAVAGNMDPRELTGLLAQKEIIEVGKYAIGVMHGSGHPDKLIDLLSEAFAKDKIDIIIFGHSHKAFNEKKGDILYFNPGSPTDKIFAHYNSYGIIEINGQIKAKIVKIYE